MLDFLPIDLIPPLYMLVGAATLFLFFIFVFWLNVLLFSYISKKLKKDAEVIQAESYEEARAILEDARNKSLDIIQQANAKAGVIVSSAQHLSEDSKESVKSEVANLHEQNLKRLEETTREMLRVYKEALNCEKEGNIQTIRDVSSDLKAGVSSEIDELKEILHKETIESQDLVKQKIEEEYNMLKGELNRYKEQELTKIDKHIYSIVAKVTKDILGHALNLEDKQELITTILAEEKQKGAFVE